VVGTSLFRNGTTHCFIKSNHFSDTRIKKRSPSEGVPRQGSNLFIAEDIICYSFLLAAEGLSIENCFRL